jgi:hypothetical protein
MDNLPNINKPTESRDLEYIHLLRDMVFQTHKFDNPDSKYPCIDESKDPSIFEMNKKAEFNNEMYGNFNLNAYSSGKSNHMMDSNGASFSPFQRVIGPEPPQIMQTNYPTQPDIYNCHAVRYQDPFYPMQPMIVSNQTSQNNSNPSNPDTEDGTKDKKEKNRLSARECRKRKKQYIESLEGEISLQKEEIRKCKEIIEEYKEKELQLTNENKMLLNVLNKINIDPEELRGRYLPQMCFASRVSNVNKVFNSLIDTMINSLNKYILWYPFNTIELCDKKAKKVMKYTTIEEKSAQEYIIQ